VEYDIALSLASSDSVDKGELCLQDEEKLVIVRKEGTVTDCVVVNSLSLEKKIP